MGLFFSNHIVVQRETGKVVEEQVPIDLRVKLWFLFQTPVGRLIVRSRWFQRYILAETRALGRKYDAPDSKGHIPTFIAAYAVDVTDLAQPLDSFACFNDFFGRTLAPGTRPIHKPADPYAAVIPADCRLLVFDSQRDAREVWVKGQRFSLARLLHDDDRGLTRNPSSNCPSTGKHHHASPSSSEAVRCAGGRDENGGDQNGNACCDGHRATAEELDKCALVISRLSPGDYHRFHSPVKGTIRSIRHLGAELHSVKPVAMCSPVNVFCLNKRVIIELDSEAFGRTWVVAVGAAHVASVILSLGDGAKVDKGAELGKFLYGGSAVVLVFGEGSISFDADLVKNSARGRETLVKVGTSLGGAAR